MLVFFTDLDGTLLDHDTYDWQPARQAIQRIQTGGHALILCTSKSLAEVAALWRAMGLADPVIVENGGAICLPPRYFGETLPAAVVRGGWEVLELGAPYSELVRALGEAAGVSGVAVRGFSQMDPAELALRTGLPLETARLAHQREFDEPFVVEEGDPALLCAAIEHLGYSWTRGGRFFHILRSCDKARAVRRLTALFQDHRAVERTVGLGDGLNDAGFLRETGSAWLLPSRQTAELTRLVPGARAAPEKGPAGWSQAVEDELAR